jgi:hypothetical protein
MSDQQDIFVEEFPTGRDSVEQAQGFKKMDLAFPDPKPPRQIDPAKLNDDDEPLGPADAAKELIGRRLGGREAEGGETADAPAFEPTERQYNRAYGAGERMPENEVVELDRAARDLGGVREAEQAAEATALENELAQAIDQLRAGDTAQPQPQEQQQDQSQPAAEAQPDSVWQRPEVLAEVSKYVDQVGGAVQQAHAQMAEELSKAAASASASVLASFPELQGVQDLASAVQVLDRTNPERGQQLRAHIENVNRITAQAEAAQRQQVQAYQQQHRAQFDYVAKLADDAFDHYAATAEPDASRRQEISGYARTMLREGGMSDQEINYHWQSSPILRSALGQQILFDAARFRIAQQTARSKAVRSVPIVQRPGSPAARGSEVDYNFGKLSAELQRTGSPKAAAALLTAQRAGRR